MRPRIAVVGIGHELRGDDAAGIAVARRLQALPDNAKLVIDAGPAPENFTGTLRRFDPQVLILVDAVQIGEPPGTICLSGIDSVLPDSATTHTLSLHLLADFLQAALDCEILLLGIQPAHDALGSDLSEEVETSVAQVIDVLRNL